MREAIDVRRGVNIRRHRAQMMYIYMYFDDPGVYYNKHGHEVPAALAAEAGFEVEKYAKERYKKQRMAEFKTKLEQELTAAEEAPTDTVLAERGGFKLVKLGEKHGKVFDTDGNPMNERPILLADAEALLEALAPTPVEVAVEVKPKTAPKQA